MKTNLLDIFKEANDDFTNHLSLKGNDRIIFSARFGSGKTTFLKQYFNPDNVYENFAGYNTIHLFPVNYSIASNEDIFKYLKYDLLCDLLLTKGAIVNEESSQSYIDSLKKYGKSNLHKIVAAFIPLIPAIGKDASELYTALQGIIDEVEEIHSSDSNKVLDFFDKIENSYALYENDFITKLIEQLLQQSKESSNKQNILIIDDLDRIDPEHIFRILNVFAAHFDTNYYNEKKNKFGFDQIILVCDVNNLRNIFSAKYGIDTDFNGYIDKFFCREVYKFNISSSVKEHTRRLISSVYNRDSSHANIIWALSDDEFEHLLHTFLDYNLLSLRQILKILNGENLEIYEFYRTIQFDPSLRIQLHKVPPLIQIEILSKIFGGFDSLLNAIKSMQDRYNPTSRLDENILKNLLIIHSYEKHQFRGEAQGIYDLRGAYYRFEIRGERGKGIFIPNIIDSTGMAYNWSTARMLLFEVFEDVLILLKKKGFFH